jgi:hypothetical protein
LQRAQHVVPDGKLFPKSEKTPRKPLAIKKKAMVGLNEGLL